MQFFSSFVSNVSIPRCIIPIYMAHYKVIMIDSYLYFSLYLWAGALG